MPRPVRARDEDEKEKRRQIILDAAERVMAKQGLEKAHFGEIARKSRLSRALVYFYFPTKEELFHAVCGRGLAELRRRFEAAARGEGSGLDQVVAMGLAYYAFSHEKPLYFTLLAELQTREPDEDPGEREALAQAIGRDCLGHVAQAISRGVKDGSIRASVGDPGTSALAVWASTHGLIQVSAKKARLIEDDFRVTRDQLVHHGIGLIRASLASGRR